MSELLSTELMHYLEVLVPPRSAEMQKMEAYARQHSFPIIGPVAGYFCYQLARMVNARKVYELGSGYGYSTAWFARAVKENGGGTVHHVVWDKELSKMARNHLTRMGYEDIMHYTVGEAVAALSKTEDRFDIIFNDIGKAAYVQSLAVIEDKISSGGVLIVDNALWSGRIFNLADQSEATEGVRNLTHRLAEDPAWLTTVVPIRDGLIVARRT